jgi:hypothetical protein
MAGTEYKSIYTGLLFYPLLLRWIISSTFFILSTVLLDNTKRSFGPF